jgi:DNA-binding HxlR family transcriptional regulator
MRFGVLRRQVAGISSRVLTERLRTLEGAGFVFRHYEQTIPPAVTYGITERMKDIEKVLVQIEVLSRKWQGEGMAASAGRGASTRTGTGASQSTPVDVIRSMSVNRLIS